MGFWVIRNSSTPPRDVLIQTLPPRQRVLTLRPPIRPEFGVVWFSYATRPYICAKTSPRPGDATTLLLTRAHYSHLRRKGVSLEAELRDSSE